MVKMVFTSKYELDKKWRIRNLEKVNELNHAQLSLQKQNWWHSIGKCISYRNTKMVNKFARIYGQIYCNSKMLLTPKRFDQFWIFYIGSQRLRGQDSIIRMIQILFIFTHCEMTVGRGMLCMLKLPTDCPRWR